MLVNVGCGRVWHRDWINLDHQPSSPEVKAFDIRKPLPFENGTCDAVYASHVLEHLDRDEGRRLLRECRRVLKPGGVVRIVVPDLEDFCRYYLQRLAAVIEHPSEENDMAYNWAYLHLIDQHVRRRSGGELAPYAEQANLVANDRIRDRLSVNMLHVLHGVRRPQPPRAGAQTARESARPAKPPAANFRGGMTSGVKKLARAILLRILPDSYAEALQAASVIRAGELHRVGYDRYSLPRLLREAGFQDVAIVDPAYSAIPNFDKMELDCVNGRPRKPGSLYAEAIRTVPGVATSTTRRQREESQPGKASVAA